MFHRPAIAALCVASGMLCTLRQAEAQSYYAESFSGVGDGTASAGGPGALVGRGWIFRNQSTNTGISPYWTEFPGWGQSGSALGHGGFATWQNSSSRISAWAILPALNGQQAGDPLSLWVTKPQDAFGSNYASLEIRYSPTGATGTGSSATDVGSFTQVLATVGGTTGLPWARQQITLPGLGRVALRLVLGPVASSSNWGGSVMIDSLEMGTPPPAPYPAPVVGQTVHWTMANSPVNLARNGAGQNPQIPAGATVIVDPGVELRLASGARLEVTGNLQLAGTSSANVRLRGGGAISVGAAGLLTGSFTDAQAFIDLIYGGRASFADSTFSDPSNPSGFSYDGAGDIGHRFFDGNLDYARQVLRLDRCTFGQGCEVALLRGWLAARDCTFYRGQNVTGGTDASGGEAIIVFGNTILDGVTMNESFARLYQDHRQNRYLGNVHASGNPQGPGVWIEGGGNYFIDSDCTLTGNKWPVAMGEDSAGILPGSVLPTTGNTLNEVPETNDPSPSSERVVWADAGVPYAVLDNNTVHGQVTILPGAHVKVAEGVSFFFATDSHGRAQPTFLGEPGRPVRFSAYTPGTRWRSLTVGGTMWYGTRWDWCEVEDCYFGVSLGSAPLSIDNSVFRNNHRALYSEEYLATRKCTFENNVYSVTGERFAPNHEVRGFFDLNHPTNPNSFVNNNGVPGDDFYNSFLPSGGLIARVDHDTLNDADSDLRNNWWGTPTGPYSPTHNPTGTGDAVFFGLDEGGFLLPFRTEPPTTNPPPVVRFVTPGRQGIPGERLILAWTARDDGRIVSQRVEYSPIGNADHLFVPLADLSPDARSFEWTVPFIGTPAHGANQFIRVISVDDLGQEGIADLPIQVLNHSGYNATITPAPAVTGERRPGERLEVCFTTAGTGVTSVSGAIELENDEDAVGIGSQTPGAGATCFVLGAQTPDVSTDRARIRYTLVSSLNNVKHFYGRYFSIRPDPMLGDAPPQLALTSPPTGGQYVGGTTLTLTWTASDDESVRSFDIRASTDGGQTWQIVARDLPGTARTYGWQLPGTDGLPDVRVRVVAKDLRFQNSSAESGPFVISAGQVTNPDLCGTSDYNGDGDFGTDQDIEAYFACLAGFCCPTCWQGGSDFNGDGDFGTDEDIEAFFRVLSGAPC